MKYVLGFVVLLVLIVIVFAIPLLLFGIACENCPLKDKCEKNVRDKGTTLCHDNEHLYTTHLHNQLML